MNPVVELKKETNDDEVEVQRGIKIIEELRTILFQASKSEIPHDYRIEIIDWLNFRNKKRIENLEIEAKKKFNTGIKVERGLDMIERLDNCLRNEIQSLRIEVKNEINNESGIHGGRVSLQGVESLGGHIACFCQGYDFYEVKEEYYCFKKRKGK